MNAPAKIEAASIYSAMASAFAEIDGATKSANNPHFKSKYADLTAVIEAIKPALIKHSLFFTQSPVPCDGGISLETRLHHAGGETIGLGTLFVPANRNDAQAYGSALTYARRYALVTAFGVPTEDDDGNAAAKQGGHSQQGAVSPPAHLITKIIGLCEALGGNQVSTICSAYKIGALPELTAKQAEQVVTRLEEKLAEKAKTQSDKQAENA